MTPETGAAADAAIEELAAAAATLVKHWDAKDDALTFLDQPDGCNCAGDDHAEEPSCNCNPGCSCVSCAHWSHAQLATCWVRDCNMPSKYKLTLWRADGRTIHQPGPDVEPRTFSEQPSGSGVAQTACGDEHALQLADKIREVYGHNHGGDLEHRPRVRIERYRYVPTSTDLPASVYSVRTWAEHLNSLLTNLALRHHHGDQMPWIKPADTLAEARSMVARLAEELAKFEPVAGEVLTPEELGTRALDSTIAELVDLGYVEEVPGDDDPVEGPQ